MRVSINLQNFYFVSSLALYSRVLQMIPKTSYRWNFSSCSRFLRVYLQAKLVGYTYLRKSNVRSVRNFSWQHGLCSNFICSLKGHNSLFYRKCFDLIIRLHFSRNIKIFGRPSIVLCKNHIIRKQVTVQKTFVNIFNVSDMCVAIGGNFIKLGCRLHGNRLQL